MDAEEENKKLVKLLKIREDIKSERVEEAFLSVPRHLFVPEKLHREAYANYPLPIGHGATISQPSIVASMTELLEPEEEEDVILEVGTGSGWQAGILAQLVKKVYSVELVPELAEQARNNLKKAGISNVEVRVGQGKKGWNEKAPFDKIIVTAATPKIYDAWKEQLRTNGVLIAPVGRFIETLTLCRKTEDGWEEEELYACRFVPLKT